MKFENKTILIVSNEPWSEIWYSKHNYAWELSKKNTVFFINSPLKWKISNLLKPLIVAKNINNSLSAIQTLNRFPAAFSWIKEINNFFLSKKLKRFLRKNNYSDVILWSFSPQLLFRPGLLGCEFSIFHVADQHWSNFYGMKQLSRKSDLILFVSGLITPEYKNFNTRKLVVGHGISDEEFEIDPAQNERILNELKSYGEFGLYAGAIDIRLDFKAIQILANMNRETNFIFIGPLNINKDHPFIHLFNGTTKNIFYLGKKHYKELRYFIRNSSFCITPMKMDHPGNDISHHKTIPYLAQGKPIFSPVFREYLRYTDFMYMENNPEILAQMIKNRKPENDSKLINGRIMLAKSFSYSGIIKKIEEFI